jgi:ElaB/YqjD/DUF883 family membrane-anchored ribosome-binding protein
MAMQTGTRRPTGSTNPAGTERIQDAATGLMDQAGKTAEAQASSAMTQAGETLQQLAKAVRDAGNGVRNERPEIASVANTAADQVDRAASYLRQHDAGDAVNAATDFARRQPALVVGGALLAGLALGRFLRSATGEPARWESGASTWRGDDLSSAYGYGPGRGYGASTAAMTASTGGTTARPRTGTRSPTGSNTTRAAATRRTCSTTTSTTSTTSPTGTKRTKGT